MGLKSGACAACAALVLSVAAQGEIWEGLLPQEFWAGRKRHPAVVHSVTAVKDGSIVSLAGEWQILMRDHHLGYPHYMGAKDAPFEKDGRTIRVPGAWEAQGIGEKAEPKPHLCIDCSPKPLRNVHLGHGHYRRSVRIPADWKGKRIWLKVGGVRNRGFFHVNRKGVGMVDCYAGAWKFEITDLVTPGEDALVEAIVDNCYGARNTQPSAVHSFGGLVRDVELEATPSECFIDDAWVRGDFDKHLAEAHVEIEGKREEVRSKRLRVTIDGETVAQTIEQSDIPNIRTIKVPLRNFRPWSPEHPNLYTARVELVEGGTVVQTRIERFGVRKLEVRGKELYLNGEPLYVRGFGDDSVYPITGFSPASREYHLEHLRKAKAAGFNFVRLHTHCEVPEYFEAADEVGIMVQPELSYYFDQTMDTFDYDPLRDARERFVAFRRHPCWCFSSSGNEGSLGPVAGGLLYAYLKATDPDRLVNEQDGPYMPVPEGQVPPRPVGDFRSGPLNVWTRGLFDPPQPFVCHEYMNLSVKQDSRLEPKFTGVWKAPTTRADRKAVLDKAGLSLELGDRLQDSQHALQKVFQKLGVEQARRDPYCDGYCYWTIADVVVRNEKLGCYAAQGFLDCLWEEKPCGAKLSDFAVFNSPRCLLCDFDRRPLPPPGGLRDEKGSSWFSKGEFADTNRVFTAGDRIPVVFMFANYGAAMEGAKLAWRFGDFASEERDVGDLAKGPVRDLLATELVAPEVTRPTKAPLSLVLSAPGTAAVTNCWDFWFFPRRMPVDGAGLACSDSLKGILSARYPGIRGEGGAASAKVVIAEAGSAAEKSALEAGRCVISLSGMTNAPSYKLGWWWLGSQVGTVFNAHPAFGGFPREDFLSPLFFRIIREGARLPLADVSEKDLVVAGEGGDGFYAYLAETRSPAGARCLRVFGLDVLSDTPEGKSLLDGFVAYLSAAAVPPFHATAEDAAKQMVAELGGRFLTREGLILDYAVPFSEIPTPEEVRDLKPNAMSWITPIENGAMFTGPTLAALVARAERTHDAAEIALCRKYAAGLALVASVSDVPGFVARGVAQDGRTHYPLGSIDQTVPWLYGLYRYLRSGLPSADERRNLTEIVRRVARGVEDAEWRAPGDGVFAGQDRGTLDEGNPFRGATHILFFLRATYEVTGERRYLDLYEERKRGRTPGCDRTRLEVCGEGWKADIPYLAGLEPRRLWIYVVAQATLAELAALEGDPAAAETMRRGLAAGAARAARWIGCATPFDNSSGEVVSWRTAPWRPQKTQADANAVASRQWGANGPRRWYEFDTVAVPLTAALLAAFDPADRFRPSIDEAIRRIDYAKPCFSHFYAGLLAHEAQGVRTPCCRK